MDEATGFPFLSFVQAREIGEPRRRLVADHTSDYNQCPAQFRDAI